MQDNNPLQDNIHCNKTTSVSVCNIFYDNRWFLLEPLRNHAQGRRTPLDMTTSNLLLYGRLYRCTEYNTALLVGHAATELYITS